MLATLHPRSQPPWPTAPTPTHTNSRTPTPRTCWPTSRRSRCFGDQLPRVNPRRRCGSSGVASSLQGQNALLWDPMEALLVGSHAARMPDSLGDGFPRIKAGWRSSGEPPSYGTDGRSPLVRTRRRARPPAHLRNFESHQSRPLAVLLGLRMCASSVLATRRRAGPLLRRCSRCSRCSHPGRRRIRRTRPTSTSPRA
jgi:hypothetical protein